MTKEEIEKKIAGLEKDIERLGKEQRKSQREIMVLSRELYQLEGAKSLFEDKSDSLLIDDGLD